MAGAGFALTFLPSEHGRGGTGLNRRDRRRAARSGGATLASPRIPLSEAQRLLAQALQLHQAGRLAEAESIYRRVLALRPDDPEALHFLGLAAHQRGDDAQAVMLMERAIAREGGIATWHNNLGEVYRAQGRLDDAIRCYRRAVALAPALGAARYCLGAALLEKGDYDAAAAELTAAVRASPGDAEAHLALGGALKGKGDLRGAYAALVRAAELAPGLAEAHYRIGLVLSALERYDEAALALRRAVQLAPTLIGAVLALAEALRLQQKSVESIACYEEALRLDPASLVAVNGIGHALLEQGRFDEARAWFAKALAHDPRSAEGHFNMGLAFQLQGRFEEAIAWHEKAIALDPGHANAHYNLVKSRKFGSQDDRRRELEAVLAMPSLADEQRAGLNFALAKTCDDLGDYDAAFRHYKEANDLKRARLPYRPEDFTTYVDRLIAAFDENLFAAKRGIGSQSELPVFIVGMPRSGTTLVEQILASHPEVHGAGELDYLRQLVHELPERLGGAPYPAGMTRLDAAAAQAIANAHLARLREHSATAARITDKMPNNFARLGVIALLFPRARLIHCVRDPLDTCLSCYFQEFAHGQPFAYDLDALGRYYRDYQRLMAHWRAVLPSPILDVPYEALVADQEGWSRKLVAFLGLPWDERCLAFYENERLVRTASFWQVRQPIYASSIGRWRHYARHLGPLFAALGIAPPPA